MMKKGISRFSQSKKDRFIGFTQSKKDRLCEFPQSKKDQNVACQGTDLRQIGVDGQVSRKRGPPPLTNPASAFRRLQNQQS